VKIRVGLVKGRQRPESLAAVLAHPELGLEQVDDILIGRVDKDPAVIEGTIVDIGFVVNQSPVFSAIGRTVKAVLAGFHQGIDNVRATGSKSYPAPAELPGRQTVFLGQPGPGLAAVPGDIKAAAGAARNKEPGITAVFPHSHYDVVRVSRVQGQV